jgi:hypothetical protein
MGNIQHGIRKIFPTTNKADVQLFLSSTYGVRLLFQIRNCRLAIDPLMLLRTTEFRWLPGNRTSVYCCKMSRRSPPTGVRSCRWVCLKSRGNLSLLICGQYCVLVTHLKWSRCDVSDYRFAVGTTYQSHFETEHAPEVFVFGTCEPYRKPFISGMSWWCSGATAQTGPWPPFTGFMIICISTMWGYQLHDRPLQDTLIQPSEPSSSNH